MKKVLPLAQALFILLVAACGGSSSHTTPQDPPSLEESTSGLSLQNCTPLSVLSVIASGSDGNEPGNTLDDRLDTRWSNLGKGGWIDYDLGSPLPFSAVAVAWHEGDKRANTFTVSTSVDGINYTQVYSGTSTGKTTAAETYALGNRTSRRVRITFQGNTVNDWASIAEARVCAGSTPSVLWSSGFEASNLKEWDSIQMVSADRLQVVSSPARVGTKALKVTVKQGDDPINASGNRNELVKMTLEAPGSEYYYRWSTMFDPTFPSVKTWQLFTQWHHEGSGGSPPVEFYVYGEEIRLNIGGDPGVIVWKTPMVRGKWLDFIFHVKWSSDPSVGFVELYLNGQLVLAKRQIATQFPGMVNYLKMGLYRSDTVQPDGIVYHDDWSMARNLSDVLY